MAGARASERSAAATHSSCTLDPWGTHFFGLKVFACIGGHEGVGVRGARAQPHFVEEPLEHLRKEQCKDVQSQCVFTDRADELDR